MGAKDLTVALEKAVVAARLFVLSADTSRIVRCGFIPMSQLSLPGPSIEAEAEILV